LIIQRLVEEIKKVDLYIPVYKLGVKIEEWFVKVKEESGES